MTIAAKIISWASLIALITPPLLFLTGRMDIDRVKMIMLIVTIVWFVSASFWMWDSDSNK